LNRKQLKRHYREKTSLRGTKKLAKKDGNVLSSGLTKDGKVANRLPCQQRRISGEGESAGDLGFDLSGGLSMEFWQSKEGQ